MSGEELKSKLTSWGVNFANLAKSVGYDSDSRLHQHFKAADVKSGLIERIALVLGKSISEMYGEDSSSDSTKSTISRQSKTIESQQKTIDRLTRLLERASQEK